MHVVNVVIIREELQRQIKESLKIVQFSHLTTINGSPIPPTFLPLQERENPQKKRENLHFYVRETHFHTKIFDL